MGGRNLVRVRIVVAAIMTLSRAKTLARPKKTPALQANHTPSLFFFPARNSFPTKNKIHLFHGLLIGFSELKPSSNLVQ